jgi:YegS/Rv2252/BmrU family lipid kinase
LPTKGTLFINRRSGVRLAPQATGDLVQAAETAGLEIVELTPELDVAQACRERISRGVRLIIAAGGDGTVNHVLQGIVNTEASLAVIPLGTYNHFARDLNIPLDWRAALDVALSGDRTQVDCARVNDRFFINNVSLGLYPELVARREERGRDYPRWKARLYAFYMTMRKYPHVTVAVESEFHQEMIRTHVFMISNNAYDVSRVGLEAPRASLSEGKLNVVWLPHTPRLRLMKFAAHYLAGRVREMPGFRAFRTVRLRVQSSHKHLTLGIDGELFTMGLPLVITTVPQSVVVRVPKA